jgi:hypothetical protein
VQRSFKESVALDELRKNGQGRGAFLSRKSCPQ